LLGKSPPVDVVKPADNATILLPICLKCLPISVHFGWCLWVCQCRIERMFEGFETWRANATGAMAEYVAARQQIEELETQAARLLGAVVDAYTWPQDVAEPSRLDQYSVEHVNGYAFGEDLTGELALANHMSITGARFLVADTVTLINRLPQCWGKVNPRADPSNRRGLLTDVLLAPIGVLDVGLVANRVISSDWLALGNPTIHLFRDRAHSIVGQCHGLGGQHLFWRHGQREGHPMLGGHPRQEHVEAVRQVQPHRLHDPLSLTLHSLIGAKTLEWRVFVHLLILLKCLPLTFVGYAGDIGIGLKLLLD